MNEHLYNFNGKTEDVFLMGTGAVKLTVNKLRRFLTVTGPDGYTRSYPLDQGRRPGQTALRIGKDQCGATTLEVGAVDFKGKPEHWESLPLNESLADLEFEVRTSGGHIGVLDIRDVGRQAKTHFFMDLMPILLQIEGNYLRIHTLAYDPAFNVAPWYLQKAV